MTAPSPNPRVFISATSADLGSVRRAVTDALLTIDCFPVEQTSFAPDYRSVHDMLRAKIESCQAFIHIAGMRYGAEPDPDSLPQGLPRRSFTQMEYDIALELASERGDEKFRVYCFVCPENFPFDLADKESQDKRELQLQHRAAILSGVRMHETPATTADLESRVLALREKVMSLEVLQQEVQQEVRSAAQKGVTAALWILGLISVLAVAFVFKLLADRRLAGEVTRQVRATEAQVVVVDRQTQQAKLATEQVAAAASEQQRAAQSLGKVGGKLIEMSEDQLVESVSADAGLDLRELRQLIVLARRGTGPAAMAAEQLKAGHFDSAYALARIHGEDELGQQTPDFTAVARSFCLACEAMIRLGRVRPAVDMAGRARQLFHAGVLDPERDSQAYLRTLLMQGRSLHLKALTASPADALRFLKESLGYSEEAESIAKRHSLPQAQADAMEWQVRALAEQADRDSVSVMNALRQRAAEIIRRALNLQSLEVRQNAQFRLLDIDLRLRNTETAHEVDALAELANVQAELESMQKRAASDSSDEIEWGTSNSLARCQFARANIFRMREAGCWKRPAYDEWIEERRWNYSPEATSWLASALDHVRAAIQTAERSRQWFAWADSMLLSADILGAKGEGRRAADACRAVLHKFPKAEFPQTWIRILCSQWQFEIPSPQKVETGQKPTPWQVEWPGLDEFRAQRDELQKLVPDSDSQDWARIMAARTMFWLSAAGCIDKELLVSTQKYRDGWFNGLTLPVELCKSARAAATEAQRVYAKDLAPRIWMRLELLVNSGFISYCALGLDGQFKYWRAPEAVISNMKNITTLLDANRSPIEYARAETLMLFGLGHKASRENEDLSERARAHLKLLDVSDRLWASGWIDATNELKDWEDALGEVNGTPLDSGAKRELFAKLEKALQAVGDRCGEDGTIKEKIDLRLRQLRRSLESP